jgi:hypothetical protein
MTLVSYIISTMARQLYRKRYSFSPYPYYVSSILCHFILFFLFIILIILTKTIFFNIFIYFPFFPFHILIHGKSKEEYLIYLNRWIVYACFLLCFPKKYNKNKIKYWRKIDGKKKNLFRFSFGKKIIYIIKILYMKNKKKNFVQRKMKNKFFSYIFIIYQRRRKMNGMSFEKKN